MIRRRILLGVLFAVLFALGWWVGRGRAAGGGLYSNLDLFVEVLHAVQTSYVDDVEPGTLVSGGLRGMLRGLDPWSEYLDDDEWKGFQNALSGEFDGIGLFVDSRDGWPVVIAPVEGSPAWQAGIEAGDVITRVDGHSTWAHGPPELASRLRGEAGTSVTLGILRGEESREREFTVRRERVEVPAVRNVTVMPGGVGYLRLAAFNERAAADVRAALESLRREGARSLVVDLRGNPGGLVDQAVEVAGAFLPAGALVTYTEGRQASDARRLVVAREARPVGWPMAVLVDEGSASAAEIVAGALQDLDRALVVGETTYGKGTVQSVFPLRNGAGAIKLTTAHYHTPLGRSIHRPAASPDFEDDEAMAPEDEPGAPVADSVAADSAAHPAYRTKAGRVVHGGGGIAPDLEARTDSLPPAGDLAAARVALAGDAAFARAAAVLRRAKSPADVFALAGPAAAPAPRPRAARPAPHPVPGQR